MIGAMAVAGEDGVPDYLWPGVFQPALVSMPVCTAAYGAEGSWEEGVGYWGYASVGGHVVHACLLWLSVQVSLVFVWE